MVAKTPAKTGVETIGTTRSEQVAAALSSVLLLLAVTTAGMFLAWMLASIAWNRPTAAAKLMDVGGGYLGDSPTGGEQQLDAPSLAEVPEMVRDEKVDEALEGITSLVSIEDLNLDVVVPHRRKKGAEGPGDVDGISAWERWEIKFSSSDIDIYAQQLDFFQVELGVAGGGIDVIDYCSNLSAGSPNRRVGSPQQEKRLFFLYKSGSLREADRALARKAGIEVSDRVVVQYYSPEMYQRLLTLENERKGKRRISDVKKTTFAVRGTPGKWEFFVVDQQYRALLPSQSKL